MNRRAVVLFAGALALIAGRATAQTPSCTFLCSPTLVAQPGLIVSNALNPPAGTSSHTDFNLRFTTVVPTAVSRLALVGLFQWQPWADNNSPAVVYGGSINLVKPSDTGGWLGVNFNPLGVYSPRPTVFDEKPYTHKLDLEGGLDVYVFKGLAADNYLHHASVYGLIDYLALGMPSGSGRWVLLTGLTLPLAPWPHAEAGRRASR